MSISRSARVVIGANFGDEGKGLLTDYYTQRKNYEKHLVIRYNGGAQAGHTVVTPEGKRHVFGHFSSGTFNGATTFLSEFFIVNPLLFKKEYDAFARHGITPPRVFVDPRARVTTHFDMLINAAAEEARGKNRHGSCGVGIHETVRRCANPAYTIQVADLIHADHLRRRCKTIRHDWIAYRLLELGIPQGLESRRADVDSEENVEQWLEAVQFFNEHTYHLTPEALIEDWEITFEGAQGLALDQNSHYFPNVTPSSTGMPHVVRICNEIGVQTLDVTYVTRCYLTRHGAGPLPFEMLAGKPYKGIEDKTNLPHDFQGTLRFAPLNLDQLYNAIRLDRRVASEFFRLSTCMAVTCLDQIAPNEQARWIVHDNHAQGSVKELLETIRYRAGLPIALVSQGPTRDHVIPYKDWR